MASVIIYKIWILNKMRRCDVSIHIFKDQGTQKGKAGQTNKMGISCAFEIFFVISLVLKKVLFFCEKRAII